MPISFVIGNNEIETVILKAEETVIQFALYLYQAITSGTPVDTGHARANWLIDFANLVARIEGSRPEVPGRAPRSGALIPAPSGSQLQTWRTDRGNIFIHNSVDYVRYLEQGRSDQADQGIVLPALAAAEARFG